MVRCSSWRPRTFPLACHGSGLDSENGARGKSPVGAAGRPRAVWVCTGRHAWDSRGTIPRIRKWTVIEHMARSQLLHSLSKTLRASTLKAAKERATIDPRMQRPRAIPHTLDYLRWACQDSPRDTPSASRPTGATGGGPEITRAGVTASLRQTSSPCEWQGTALGGPAK